MSEITVKVTVPVLEELAARDEGFVVKLSHAAAKEIGERYSDAIISSAVVKKTLDKMDAAIVAAQVCAGSQLEQKIGEWSNGYHTGYRLREDVVKYIDANFQRLVQARFDAWLKTSAAGEAFDAALKNYAERKIAEIMKKEIGEFLRKW